MIPARSVLAAVLWLPASVQAQNLKLPLGPPAGPPPGLAPDPAPALPNLWQQRGTAELQVLDKVYARRAVLSIRQGESGSFGTLSILVRTCVVRPPDRAPDAAAYVTVTDSRMDKPAFAGWMLHTAPGASMLEHPIYDIRVNACR